MGTNAVYTSMSSSYNLFYVGFPHTHWAHRALHSCCYHMNSINKSAAYNYVNWIYLYTQGRQNPVLDIHVRWSFTMQVNCLLDVIINTTQKKRVIYSTTIAITNKVAVHQCVHHRRLYALQYTRDHLVNWTMGQGVCLLSKVAFRHCWYDLSLLVGYT